MIRKSKILKNVASTIGRARRSQERVDAAVVVVAAVVAAVGVQVAADAEAEGAVGRAELEAAGAGHRDGRGRLGRGRGFLLDLELPGQDAELLVERVDALFGGLRSRLRLGGRRSPARATGAGVWAATVAAVHDRKAATRQGQQGARTDDGTWIRAPRWTHVHRDGSPTTIDTTPTAVTGASRTRGDRASARRSRELGCEETNGPVPAADAAATSYLQLQQQHAVAGRPGVMPPTRWTGAVGGK